MPAFVLKSDFHLFRDRRKHQTILMVFPNSLNCHRIKKSAYLHIIVFVINIY